MFKHDSLNTQYFIYHLGFVEYICLHGNSRLHRALRLVDSHHVGPEYKQGPVLRNGGTIYFPKIMAQRWQ